MPRLPALDALRIFHVAARHGNFTAAARELHLTPAAVSVRMRGLEAELAAQLFRRSGPRLTLTPKGVALAEALAPALSDISAAVAALRAESPMLRIDAAPGFAARWLAQRMPGLTLGDVRIDLRASPTLSPVESFDIAMRSGLGPWPGLRTVAKRLIGATPMLSPTLGASRVTAPADLLAYPIIADPLWARWFSEMDVESPAIRLSGIEYPTQDLAAAAALEGGGVALLSPYAFGGLVDEGRLVQPFDHVIWGPAAYHLLIGSEEERPYVLSLADQLASALDDAGTAVEQAGA